jgi:hypothetical protein
VQPPQGEPATLEALIHRADAFLAKYPHHQAAKQRQAELQAEFDRRFDLWCRAETDFEDKAQRLEEAEGHLCPGKAGLKRNGMYAGICHEESAKQGWVCVRKRVMMEENHD